MGIRFSQSEFPVKTAKEHWLALAFYVAIVAFLASVYPTNLLLDLTIQISLSFVLFGAFQLVRKTRHCGVPTRAAFWAWFVIVCGFWLLYLWKLISTAVFGSPNTGL
jgi:hypothetical protein